MLVLSMADTTAQLGIKVNTDKLASRLGLPVVLVSSRTGENMEQLATELEKLVQNIRQMTKIAPTRFYQLNTLENQVAEAVMLNLGGNNAYQALLIAHHHDWLPFLKPADRTTLSAIAATKGFVPLRAQVEETLGRYDQFTPIVRESILQVNPHPPAATDKIDALLTNRWAGPLLFFTIMLLIFQAIFVWSVYPMNWIESAFASLSDTLVRVLPDTWYTNLLTDGILAGLSGIMVFIPQIAMLFLLITILEEVGYMSRVVFMFDKSMRRVGMNGRSVISLIGGGACAVPAIMSSRTIGNWQEKLITTMVTPFIPCSARIPVYLVLIGFAIPPVKLGGLIHVQTIVFGGMYAFGVLVAYGAAWALKKYLKTKEASFLAIELPEYRIPDWKNVGLAVWEKVASFVIGAGKIILLVSVALWALSRYGPANKMEKAIEKARQTAQAKKLDKQKTDDLTASYKLEASYAGQMGKFIEPAIRPLGYDWKIGIALITSFAAREVFTGTLAVLYNMGSADGEISSRNENAAKSNLRSKMRQETFHDTGTPVYSTATVLSLLVFYALSLQCMSTIAVVIREAKSIGWAVFQFAFMGTFAYLSAWMVYSLLA
jgi:ferrous iron transport protein B